jgi:hypothetical protein
MAPTSFQLLTTSARTTLGAFSSHRILYSTLLPIYPSPRPCCHRDYPICFSFTVYLNREFIHSENGELIAVKEYPAEVCTLKTTLLLNDNRQRSFGVLVSFRALLSLILILFHNSSEIERYAIVLDITDTSLCIRRHLFSVNITLEPTPDAVPPSPTASSAGVVTRNACRKDDNRH